MGRGAMHWPVAVALVATALATAGAGTTGSQSAALVAAAPVAAAAGSAGGQGQRGGRVTVLGTWGGSEQASFLAMVKPFEERTGITVDYQGTRDLNAILTTRLQGGNPPDVSGLPGPGQMAEFARAGKLVDLSGFLDEAAMRDQYSDDWLKLGSVDGHHVGIFVKTALKG